MNFTANFTLLFEKKTFLNPFQKIDFCSFKNIKKVRKDVSSFSEKSESVKIAAHLRVLLWEDAYIRPGDSGYKHFANYVNFVLQKLLCVDILCTVFQLTYF